MSHHLVLIAPGSFDTRSGGYEYDRRIVAGLRDQGWLVDVVSVDESFPQPTPAALEHASGVLAAIPAGRTVMIDGLALGAMPSVAGREASRLRLVALVHHPLAAETGLDPGAAAALARSEREALAAVRLVVVTSETTATSLVDYGVERARLTVVEPGTNRTPLARGSTGLLLELLSVAALIPRKGHDVLFRALALIPERNWHLTCVGALQRDVSFVRRLRAALGAERLENYVSLVDEVAPDAVGPYYDRADVFVLPTLYEGYGMAVAEALACGLPVISTPTGAIAELLSKSPPAGVLVPPGDSAALARALSDVVSNPSVRAALAEGARSVRDRLPTWADSSTKMAERLARLTDRE